METSEMLPIWTIISMWTGLVLTLILPVAALIFFGKKERGSFRAAFWGVLSYGISFCIYGIFWCIYVVIFSKGYDTVGLTWDYYLVLAVLTGICATACNYLFLRKICKKNSRPGVGVSLYAGFALVVCYQTVISQIKDLYWAMSYNRMGLEALTDSLSSSKAAQVTEQLYYISMNNTLYFVKGLEVLLYLSCYAAMGYLLFFVVKREKKWQILILFPLMILQFGIALPAQLMKSGAIDISEKELLLGIVAALTCIPAGVILLKKRKKKE